MNRYARSAPSSSRMSEPTTSTTGESNAERAVESEGAAAADRNLRWGAYLIALSGVGLVANALAILYRALYSAGFEAGVGALDGVTKAELAASSPELAHYVDHLHVNVAGLMAALGVGVIALSWFGVRRGQRWALATAVSLPVIFVAHSLPVHRVAGFSFDPVLHLGPGAVWLPALILGAALATPGVIGDRPDGGTR